MRRWVCIAVFFSLILSSCGYNKQVPSDDLVGAVDMEKLEAENVKEIFYNLYLPDEMSRIFHKVGADFNPVLTHSPDNFSSYVSNHEVALALGIYGIDLNYSRLFEQKSLVANYFTVIKILSERIGIPSDYYEDLFLELKKDYVDPDSLGLMVSRIYKKTDHFLKDNEEDSSAALIIAGGWIEALYLACSILEENPYNMELLNRIAEQKYSLNSLIFLLRNYQDNLFISEYLLMLNRLKKAFDRFEIYFYKEKFALDTTHRIIRASDYESDIDSGIAEEITSIIQSIRKRITG